MGQWFEKRAGPDTIIKTYPTPVDICPVQQTSYLSWRPVYLVSSCPTSAHGRPEDPKQRLSLHSSFFFLISRSRFFLKHWWKNKEIYEEQSVLIGGIVLRVFLCFSIFLARRLFVVELNYPEVSWPFGNQVNCLTFQFRNSSVQLRASLHPHQWYS